MLKVNLNKTKIQTRSRIGAGTKSSISMMSDSSRVSVLSTGLKDLKAADLLQNLDAALVLKIVVKLILVLCFPLGLKIYETWHLNELKREKAVFEGSFAERTKERDRLKQEVKSFEYLVNQANEYKQKKKFLEKLAHSRLIIPQLLDQIQSVVPESVWLKNLKVEIKDKGNLYLNGESLSEDRINLFANSLKNIVNRNTITLNTRDVKGEKDFVKVSFDLWAELLAGGSF